ncbi:uncharacterized protein LOC105381098 [Plutella xylostella]|uniref:uncharacterized protein LOC105381098 n=1 Tax=Plutella xylostella TaxID=51655 RepID=UPI0020325B86|nr:uncharacterized protein LOC105381098 [Plutella xylostella]
MDPIAVLQNRIEQLEAKLGVAPVNTPGEAPQGDTATANLLSTAQAMTNATAGHEKLSEAMNMASELNNYTDPNLMENIQQNNMHRQEVEAAEAMIKNHCQCLNHCKQAAPVLESEAIAEVPKMQATVDRMHAEAAAVKTEADAVSLGVQQLAETCGAAASDASERLAGVAHSVDQAEEKLFPKRRNGLD